jgi:hypothetical protein
VKSRIWFGDPHQSEKVEASGGKENGRIRIRIKLKGRPRIRIRVKGRIRIRDADPLCANSRLMLAGHEREPDDPVLL